MIVVKEPELYKRKEIDEETTLKGELVDIYVICIRIVGGCSSWSSNLLQKIPVPVFLAEGEPSY